MTENLCNDTFMCMLYDGDVVRSSNLCFLVFKKVKFGVLFFPGKDMLHIDSNRNKNN